MKGVGQFERLFMVPGMNHCSGGAGAVNFGQPSFGPPISVPLDPEHDVFLALQRWVEDGVAPDHLIATTDRQPQHASENPVNPASFTRRLCPYPLVARYNGTGDPNSAESFVCVTDSSDDRNRD